MTTTTTPFEIDTALAAAFEEEAKISADIHLSCLRLDSTPKDDSRRAGLVEEAVKLEADRAALFVRIADLEAQYTGWSRFFIVTSSAGGHVHSSMSCSTCLPSTTFGWLPELSGKTESEMVEAHGTAACTVCFPSAPALPAWTAAKKKEDAETGSYCSGPEKVGDSAYGHRYFGCPDCDDTVAVTRTGKLRKHLPLTKVEVACPRGGKKPGKNTWVLPTSHPYAKNGHPVVHCGCDRIVDVIDGALVDHTKKKMKEVRG